MVLIILVILDDCSANCNVDLDENDFPLVNRDTEYYDYGHGEAPETYESYGKMSFSSVLILL